MEQMIEEIEEVFPSGIPSEWITTGELEAYLLEEKFRAFLSEKPVVNEQVVLNIRR